MATLRSSINNLKGMKVLPDARLRKNDDMYPMTKLPYGTSQIQEKYDSILGPLTLFAPFTHEEKKVAKKILQVPNEQELELDRPVTPIDKSIHAPPAVFTELAKLVRRRITADPEIQHLSVEDQQTLAGIVMGEVNSIWPDIRRQVDDPFLTPDQNKELQRRITVHIVTVCEQLFHHYIDKAQILNRRGIFSGPSNMSRLKAQLALDANKFLNILAIRRHIVADLRGQLPSSEDESSDEEKAKTISSGAVPLSYKRLIEISRPKKKKKRQFKIQKEIRDLERQMPYLETEKVYEYLPDIRQFERHEDFDEYTVTPDAASAAETHSRQSSTKDSFRLSGKLAQEKPDFKVQRSISMPELHDHDALTEEFGIDDDDKASVKSSYHPGIETRRFSLGDLLLKEEEKDKEKEIKGTQDTRQILQDDLMKLSQYKSVKDSKEEPLDEDEDLPPLLQAISKTGQVEGRKEMLEQQLKDLTEKEAREKAAELIKIRDPTHPQPATITKKMPNQSVVRTSDIRVSERVSLSSVTLDLYTTVFNELMGDIEPQTIKKLDRNLFFGQEINEVYEEIMKTLPNDHFRHDQDSLIEPSADQVNLSILLSSSVAGKSRKERHLNPNLKRDAKPPWGEENMVEWAKSPLFNAGQLIKQRAMGAPTPASGMMSFQDYPVSLGGTYAAPGMGAASSYAGGEAYGGGASSYGGGAMTGTILDMQSTISGPAVVDDRNSRAYASWLNWWKSTVNSDDYMKYLSTQESDYLGVVFHFYDSGDSDDDDEKADKKGPSQAKLERMRARKEKVNELKREKSAFKPGEWNVNSVLMGGLGRDPEVEMEEEEEEEEVITPRSMRSRRSRMTSRSQTSASRGQSHGSRSQTAGSGTHTALSQKSSAERTHKDSLNVRDGDTKSTSAHSSRVHTAASGRVESKASSGTRRTSHASRVSEISSAKSDAESSKVSVPLTPQERLEAIWSSLQMSDKLKLDMAIKYSSDQYIDQLDESIEAWEKATEVIIQRETLIAKLESFERLASDPDRFFQKGYRGSSVARLNEAKQRSQLYSALDEIDKKVKRKVQAVKDRFNDDITFRNRPYMEKMKFDRTEMLYWLQQERRQYAIERASLAQEMPLKVAELPPLQTFS
ncbi:coiled-coil domain-containing protein 87-like isoform X2 [Ptychodera flava]|uniref:coiled-coil domain-containing protein 87-like isoform X2 n=1 Tax=Ptychodera flava TaxID=63121 RepID=UPI00396A05F7